MRHKNKRWGMLACIVGALLAAPAAAAEKEELLQIKNTILNLVDTLVEQGVLTREKADEIKREATAKAAVESATAEEEAPSADEEEVARKVVRVPYVPEFIKEEIRSDVRAELREEVAADVMQQAEEEQWGIPAALPEWVSRIEPYGDIRLRHQTDLFSDDNIANSVPDFQEINEAGGIVPAGRDAFVNTTEDRHRFRLRARLGANIDISRNLDAGFRITTGDIRDPVSTNQTLGNTGQRFDIQLDRAFLRYDAFTSPEHNWLTLVGGRFGNPFFSTDLVFDDDLGFEGFAGTLRANLAGLGGAKNELFLTGGAFPLEEIELSSRDKWLFAGQIGHEALFHNGTGTKFGVAFYSYDNITGRRNPLGSTRFDFTAPEFLQKGNTMFDIRNDANPNTNLFALASDFDLLNVTGEITLGQLAPLEVTLTGDFVKNLGFDEENVSRRVGGDVDERSYGYGAELAVGWPDYHEAGHWRVSFGYKYLQSDAVLDAFTDSDFHLGGTNAQGWILGGRYTILDNAWLRARWLSTDEIDGVPFGVDTLQIDLNARF